MAYSVDVKIKIIANVGRQMLVEGSGYLTIWEAQRVSDGKRLFLWSREIVAGGVTRGAWFYSTKTSVMTNLNSSIRNIALEPALDFSLFMDEARPDFVVYDSGEVPAENITNDAGNRLRNIKDTSGNIAVGVWLGDGISAYPYAESVNNGVSGSGGTVYTPPKATANAGFFAPITDFISQNPLTSTVIAISIAIALYWAYNEYEESKGKGKKKRRRG